MIGGLINFQGLSVEQFFELMDERNRAIIREVIGGQTLSHQTEIIDRSELCKRLDVTEPTIIRWEKKGRIPRLAIGAAIRYDWPKVLAALEK